MKAKSIKELVNLALSEEFNFHAEFTLGKLPAKQSRIIESLIGSKLVGSDRIIDTSGIRHTLKKHGSEINESKHGQIAVSIDDFNKVPHILREPDQIVYSGKNRLKQDVFLYQKKIGVIYYVAEALRISKKGDRLVFQTMYKRK
jgi:hypothetical protein